MRWPPPEAAAGPWLDLARMELREPRLQRAVLDAYFPAGIPADAPLHMANHRLLSMLLALVWEYECGGDWLHERVPSIESALAAT
ncbi:hypothetical protein EJK15_33870 [Nonomuraea basaltis]|nr:hypothetical protein EJK15_33870 [Nonomuraea basaltis]